MTNVRLILRDFAENKATLQIFWNFQKIFVWISSRFATFLISFNPSWPCSRLGAGHLTPGQLRLPSFSPFSYSPSSVTMLTFLNLLSSSAADSSTCWMAPWGPSSCPPPLPSPSPVGTVCVPYVHNAHQCSVWGWGCNPSSQAAWAQICPGSLVTSGTLGNWTPFSYLLRGSIRLCQNFMKHYRWKNTGRCRHMVKCC